MEPSPDLPLYKWYRNKTPPPTIYCVCCTALQATVESLKKEVEAVKQGRPRESNTTVEDKNRQSLQTLSVEKVSILHLLAVPSCYSCTRLQVLLILDAIGLQEHKQTFKREKITGELLAECDEEILTSELHVTSKLQRIKLLGVIRGSPQAWTLVNRTV